MCSSIWNAIVNVFFFCCPALSHLIWPPMKFVFSVSGVEHAKRLCQMWFTWFMLNDLLMSRSNHWRAHFIRSNWYAFLSLITLMPPATSMMVHWISFRIGMKMKEAKKREKKKHHWPQTIRHLIRRNQRKRNLTKKKKKNRNIHSIQVAICKLWNKLWSETEMDGNKKIDEKTNTETRNGMHRRRANAHSNQHQFLKYRNINRSSIIDNRLVHNLNKFQFRRKFINLSLIFRGIRLRCAIRADD